MNESLPLDWPDVQQSVSGGPAETRSLFSNSFFCFVRSAGQRNCLARCFFLQRDRDEKEKNKNEAIRWNKRPVRLDIHLTD